MQKDPIQQVLKPNLPNFYASNAVIKEAKKYIRDLFPSQSISISAGSKRFSGPQFIHKIFNNIGLEYPLRDLNTWPPLEFDKIPENEAKPGDILLFDDGLGLISAEGYMIIPHRVIGIHEIPYGPRCYWGKKKQLLGAYRWVGSKPFQKLCPGEKALYKARLYEGWTWVIGNNPYKKTIDCSNLVHQAFRDSGYDFQYAKTAKWPPKEFIKIEEDDIRVGDIVLFKGHVGIISGPGVYYGSQTSTGPKEVKYGVQEYWGRERKLLGFYRWRGNDASE